MSRAWGLYVWCGAEQRFVLWDTYPTGQHATIVGEALRESYVVSELQGSLAVAVAEPLAA